jgi:hypothetical protein
MAEKPNVPFIQPAPFENFDPRVFDRKLPVEGCVLMLAVAFNDMKVSGWINQLIQSGKATESEAKDTVTPYRAELAGIPRHPAQSA